MASESPPFWWQAPDWRAVALYPASAAYAVVAAYRLTHARREKVEAPVLCVGNLTVGGSGKTPTAVALARQAKRMRLTPGFLSRGHGSVRTRPHIVDPAHDGARHVGDEPLLLAEHAPVAVSADRAAAARLLIERGCDFLIMDDGFQSARLHMDYALIVVDARYGIGNGHVVPGGPLRARVADQLRFATGILKIGEGSGADALVRLGARAGRPVFEASLKPRHGERLARRRFLAFAGIGHPDKFFDTLERTGGAVVLKRSFGDHHFYAADELQELAATASEQGLELVTTAKDAARLRRGVPDDFLRRLTVLEVDLTFDSPRAAQHIIADTLAGWRRRRTG